LLVCLREEARKLSLRRRSEFSYGDDEADISGPCGFLNENDGAEPVPRRHPFEQISNRSQNPPAENRSAVDEWNLGQAHLRLREDQVNDTQGKETMLLAAANGV